MGTYFDDDQVIKLIFGVILFFTKLIIYPIIALIMGLPFYIAWNYVMPAFGLPALGYLQSACLLLIAAWIFPTTYVPIRVKE